MIYLVAGKPGTGKTYIMSKKIKQWVAEKKYVLTNILVYPLTLRVFGKEIINEHEKFKNFYYYFNEDIQVEELWRFSEIVLGNRKKEGQIKLIIDEGLLMISKRFQENKKEFIRFLTQHRKLGYDIYILAQSKNEIDSTIRSLIDILWYVRYVREVFLIDIPYLRVFYERNMFSNEIFFFNIFFLNPFFFRFFESYKIHLKINEKEKINKEIKNIYSWREIAGVLTPA
jgi:hypothetical protein